MATPTPGPDATPAPPSEPPAAPAARVLPSWDDLRATLPQSCRAAPLSHLDLPARISSYAEREGLDTLGDLADRSRAALLAERYLGRLSLHQMVIAVRDYVAARHPSAAETAQVGEPEPEESEPRTWHDLRAALPESCRAIPLDEIDLPARLRTYAAANQLCTLGDLADRSEGELLAERNIGRTSLTQLVAAVRRHLARAGVRLTVVAPVADAVEEAEPIRDDPLRELAKTGLLASWRALLDELEPTRRTLLAERSGLDGRARTLTEIGEAMGRSRERVRQIEVEALTLLGREQGWLVEIGARVDAALHEGAVPIARLARDPWWAGVAESPDTFEYIGERVLGGRMRVVELSGLPHLARWSQQALEDAWSEIHRRAEAAVVPAPVGAFLELVEPFGETLGAAAAAVLSEKLRALLRVEESDRGSIVVGVGTNAATVLALLRASPVPLPARELRARVGTFHPTEEMLHFGKGLVGLEHHVPDFAGWKARLVPEVIRVMERGAPGRQWHANALLDELRKDRSLPDWLDQWHLVAVLRGSTDVRYLGRTRFVLADAPAGESRVQFREEVARILREHGGPMALGDLNAALDRRTSVQEHTVEMVLLQPPFVCCKRGVYGLRDRDLPGGARALALATARVADVLARRRRGLAPGQIHAEIARLSPAHRRWTLEMCLSSLHGDPRFRFSRSDVVGLSTWESVRVASRPEILRRCLEGAGGRVRLSVVARRIAACYGAPPSRDRVRNIAKLIGATLRGDFVEWESEGGPAGSSSVDPRPSATAPERRRAHGQRAQRGGREHLGSER